MRSGHASDKREMTYEDHICKELSEAGGIQETICIVQNSPDSETLEAVDLVDGTGEDTLDLGENWVQGFHSRPGSVEVG